MQKWRDVAGYNGAYMVSTNGEVLSTPRKGSSGGILSPTTVRGYYRVCLRTGGSAKSHLVHRLVAMAFLPNINNKPQVNHIDGNIKNNMVGNIEWVTSSENVAHAYRTKLHRGQSGEHNGNAKLRESDIVKIRNLYMGGALQKDIARLYGVTQVAISSIILGKSWSGVCSQ
jgi:hypothetical protein